MSFTFKSIYLERPIHVGRILDIFEPKKLTGDISVFFIHGGGWTSGSRTIYHILMEQLIQEGVICATTDYRIGNDITIADQLTDIRHAYDEFTSFLKYRNKPSKIVVSGSSAGAHLAQLITYTKPGECGESLVLGQRSLKNEWIKPTGIVPICAPVTFMPWEDIFPEIWASMQKIVGVPYWENKDIYRKYSPDAYLNEIDMPIFFFCAENEHIFPVEIVASFVAKLKARNVYAQYKVYPKCEHGFFYELKRRQQREAFSDLLNFISAI